MMNHQEEGNQQPIYYPASSNMGGAGYGGGYSMHGDQAQSFYNYNSMHGGDSAYYLSQRGGALVMVPQEKAYTIINTEPLAVNTRDNPIVLVDPPLEPYVKSYLTWSLLNLVFCCILGGVFTTILSCRVMELNDRKQYKEALRLSGRVLVLNMIVTALFGLIFLAVFPYVYMAIYPYLPKINW